MESKINRVMIAKDGYDKDPTNHNLLSHFHNAFLDLLEETSVLNENGYAMLFYDPTKDIEIVNEPNNTSQKPLVRLCICFMIMYNLNKLYCGFINSIKEYPQIIEKLPKFFIHYLEELRDKSMEIQPILNNLLKIYTNKLNDKYAKIFNQEKSLAFTKDIFGIRDKLVIPSEIDKIQKKATQAPS